MFFTVGPIEPDAVDDGLVGKLRQAAGPQLDVEYIDPRLWFASAFDGSTVRALIEALKLGVSGNSLDGETLATAKSTLGILETWLGRDAAEGA